MISSCVKVIKVPMSEEIDDIEEMKKSKIKALLFYIAVILLTIVLLGCFYK